MNWELFYKIFEGEMFMSWSAFLHDFIIILRTLIATVSINGMVVCLFIDLSCLLTYFHRENEALWREVVSMRQKHHKQQQIVNKVRCTKNIYVHSILYMTVYIDLCWIELLCYFICNAWPWLLASRRINKKKRKKEKFYLQFCNLRKFSKMVSNFLSICLFRNPTVLCFRSS